MKINFIEITLLHGCSPVNLLHIFRTTFPKNTSGGLLLYMNIEKSIFVIFLLPASILFNDNNNYNNDSPPKLCCNPTHTLSLSDSIKDENNSFVLFSEGQEMLSIMEELQKQSPSKTSINCSNDRKSGSDTISVRTLLSI